MRRCKGCVASHAVPVAAAADGHVTAVMKVWLRRASSADYRTVLLALIVGQRAALSDPTPCFLIRKSRDP